MYNSVIECVKVSNMLIGLKKRLVWACLKGVTLQKTLKEESTDKNHSDDNYSASITRCYFYLPGIDAIFVKLPFFSK